MIALQVVAAVRSRLGDARKERWTDEVLLLYVSLCQNDICTFTNFYRLTTDIQLVDNQLIYPLPSDCLKVTRLEYEGSFFPIETRNSIDSGAATIPCALKDGLNYNEIEITTGGDSTTLASILADTYGVLTSSDTEGVDTSACVLEDDFGVLAEVDEPTAPVPANLGMLTVYYSAVPKLLASPEEVLIVPDIWFAAFLHYVCGTALQDDNDANNIQRGELELKKYARLLSEINKKTMKDFTSNVKSKLNTPIRRT